MVATMERRPRPASTIVLGHKYVIHLGKGDRHLLADTPNHWGAQDGGSGSCDSWMTDSTSRAAPRPIRP